MRVGFIGLGTMGNRMAARLQEGRCELTLTVHDLRREAAASRLSAGAVWADTSRQVAEASDVVFTSLPMPADVEQVALEKDGILEGVRPGTAYFDLSTNSPVLVRKIHTAFAARGVHMLDSPVSGGPQGAVVGNLAIWVGGDKQIYESYKPLLDLMGDEVRHVGSIGAGTVVKLIHNCLGNTLNRALSEVFTMGVKAGVDPLTLWEAVRQGAVGRTRTFDRVVNNFLPNLYEPPAFALRLAHKDVALATELGRALGVPMPMANLALEELDTALERGWGERDSRASMILQLERAGVHIAVHPDAIREVLQRDLRSSKGDIQNGTRLSTAVRASGDKERLAKEI